MTILELLINRRRQLHERYQRNPHAETWARRLELNHLITLVKEKCPRASRCTACWCVEPSHPSDTSPVAHGGYVDGGGV